MNTQMMLAGLLVVFGATSASAQAPAGNDRVVKAMPARYVAPDCGIKAGHFKVSSSATYLKTGVETAVPANRARARVRSESPP